jgi:hypothetical protein
VTHTHPHRGGSISPRTGRRNRIAAQFTPIPTEAMESPAWRTLSLSARRVLDRLCIELRHHAGRNSTKLCVTYKDFVDYGITNRHCISSAVRELVALGFVRITRQGRSGNAEFRQPTLYQLTFIHNADGEPLTNEWKRITSLAAAKAVAAAARKPPSPKNKKPVPDSVPKSVSFPHRKHALARYQNGTTVRVENDTTSESLGEGGRVADGGEGVSRPLSERGTGCATAGPAAAVARRRRQRS